MIKYTEKKCTKKIGKQTFDIKIRSNRMKVETFHRMLDNLELITNQNYEVKVYNNRVA